MKSIAAALMALAMLLSAPALAQISRGTVKESLTLDSRILKGAVQYSIYLPFDYETSARKYEVLYLLHGGGGDEGSWVKLEAGTTADEAIAAREIPPMILVMPDAGTSRYVNSHDGAVAYEEFFVKELIPAIESQYRVRPGRFNRAIAGFSMGGYAALVYALKHPDTFAAAAALSAALYTDEMTLAMTQEQWDTGRGAAFGTGLKGSERFTAHYRQYDPFTIVAADRREKKGNAFRDPQWR